jgi:4-hydroxy-3-methylbut-2-en-1-yl diphosphate synthase IspG/GcpE
MSYTDALFGKRPTVDNSIRTSAVKLSEKKEKPVEVGVNSGSDSSDFDKKDQLDIPPFMRLMSRD